MIDPYEVAILVNLPCSCRLQRVVHPMRVVVLATCKDPELLRALPVTPITYRFIGYIYLTSK